MTTESTKQRTRQNVTAEERVRRQSQKKKTDDEGQGPASSGKPQTEIYNPKKVNISGEPNMRTQNGEVSIERVSAKTRLCVR